MGTVTVCPTAAGYLRAMTTTDPTTRERERPGFPAPGWWVRDRDGEIAVAQVPNPALCVWLACAVLTRLTPADRAHTVSHVGEGALLAWAVDELLRGSSPVRRLLGAAVLALVLGRLLA